MLGFVQSRWWGGIGLLLFAYRVLAKQDLLG